MLSLLKSRLSKDNAKVKCVIIGNQKSGTTAIADLLAKSIGFKAQLDIPGMYEPRQTNIHSGKLSFEDFVKRNRKAFAHEIVKEPALTFLFDKVYDHFGDQVKYVFIVRDPYNNIRSILDRVGLRGSIADGEIGIDKLSAEWKLIIDNKWLGCPFDHYIASLAWRWNQAVEVYRQFEQVLTIVRYEDFVQNKRETIFDLAKRIGFDPNSAEDLNYNAQYQSKGTGTADPNSFFGDNLELIGQVCEKNMQWLGYHNRHVG